MLLHSTFIPFGDNNVFLDNDDNDEEDRNLKIVAPINRIGLIATEFDNDKKVIHRKLGQDSQSLEVCY